MSKRPPCPGNPQDYVWVESKERKHWRRKRGSVGIAHLNAAYQCANERTRVASPAARRVRRAIEPYLRGISTGRLNNRICNAFRKSLKEKQGIELAYLKGIEMQRDYPLEQMLVCNYKVWVTKKKVRIEIPVERGSVKSFNKLVSDYYFEAVLLHGDANKERGLKTQCIESKLYSIYGEAKGICILELVVPKDEDWCVLLKLSSIEGNEVAAHTKHYRMKVISAREE